MRGVLLQTFGCRLYARALDGLFQGETNRGDLFESAICCSVCRRACRRVYCLYPF